uniref:Uncharacterized protein n=1 Tax=Arundo donax TaxID=35708 RepID=A0A0A9D2S2_ARUDO
MKQVGHLFGTAPAIPNGHLQSQNLFFLTPQSYSLHWSSQPYPLSEC